MEQEPRSQEQIFHDLSGQLPTIVWGLITASLDRESKGVQEYQDEIAELTSDASRLAEGRFGWLALFGRLSEQAADLLTEVASLRGQDPRLIAQENALEAAERAERYRATRPD